MSDHVIDTSQNLKNFPLFQSYLKDFWSELVLEGLFYYVFLHVTFYKSKKRFLNIIRETLITNIYLIHR